MGFQSVGGERASARRGCGLGETALEGTGARPLLTGTDRKGTARSSDMLTVVATGRMEG